MSAKPHHKTPAWPLSLGFAYLAVLAALTFLNCSGADRWWFGAFNLYLPQVIWAIPGIVLAAIYVKVAWRLVWLPLLGIAWVAGPLMGFCWPLPTAQVSPARPPLRVMTWNVKYGTHDKLAHMAIMYEIEKDNPSVVLLQDADGVMNGLLGDYLSAWNIRSAGQYVIASKLPLGALQVRNISYPGNGQTCVRTVLQYNGTAVVLYDVHFESPREGLYSMRVARENPEHLPKAIQKLKENVRVRLVQARTVREFLRQESGPVIVAGDLNSPEASQAFLTLREAGLHDAFAEGGKGYGYTYGHFLLRNRFPLLTASWMRIDHILMSTQFRTRKCWTGTGRASDHRPVIADLVLDHR